MTSRSSGSLLIVLLLTSALFVSIYFVATPPKKAHAATLVITLTPNIGKSGDVITIDSLAGPFANSPEGTTCTIIGSVANLVTSPLATVSGGIVYGTFIVGSAPGAAGGNSYDITVECPVTTGTPTDSGTATGANGFFVRPKLTINPSIGMPGQAISVTGVGFRSDAGGCLNFVSAPAGVLFAATPTPTCSISTSGVLNAGFTVDTVGPAPVGFYDITVTPNLGVAVTKTNGFEVVSGPTIAVSPNNVPPGYGTLDGMVSVTGGGFQAGTARNCTLTGNAGLVASTPLSCSISSTGTVTGRFAVAFGTGGGYTVTVTDTNPAGAFATKPFNVIAAPTLNAAAPPNGPPGTPVTLTNAVAFAVQDVGACTITSVPSGMISTYTCFINAAGGILTAIFIVSNNAAGQGYTVRVTGLHGDYAETAFTVTPRITLDPTFGSPPVGGSPGAPATEVTVSGRGFSVLDSGCIIDVFPAPPAPYALVIDTSGEPACTVSNGVLTAKFKVGAGSTYGVSFSVRVRGTPTLDPATATFDVKSRIVLSRSSGPAGVSVSVSGSGFDPTGAPAACNTFSSNPANLGAPGGVCTRNADGTITASFIVNGAAAPNGNYTVTVTGRGAPSTDTATALFSKIVSLNLLPPSGHPGMNVLISGTGFDAGDTGCTLIIAYPATPNLISNPLCTIAGGAMSGSFTVASGAAGSYTVKVVGTTGDFGLAPFTVPLAATLELDPISGQVGQVVSASGSNYQGTTCLLTATPSGLFTSQSCIIVAGDLTGSFTVAPNAAPGTLYTITVQTNAGAGDAATHTFAVISGTIGSIALNPLSGPVGQVVSGKAAGFSTDVSCIVVSIPSDILSSPSCIISGGNATIGFNVLSSAHPGSYTIMVLGNTGRSATQTFTVTAPPLFSLLVNPISLILSPGGTATATVTVISSGTFNSPVTLSTSFPADVSGGFSPNPVTPTMGGTVTSTLSIAVSNVAPSTTTTIPITGTGGGLTATASLSLVIQVTVTTQSTSTATTTTSSVISTTIATVTGPYVPPKCVIATATFGSEASPAVQFLRGFRDNLVLSTTAGSAFMQVFNAWYYSFSPSVAQFIANNDPIRAPIRVMLYPLLGVLGLSSLVYSLFSGAPEFGVVMAGLVASSLIGLVYLTLPALAGFSTLSRRRKIRGTSIAKVSLALLAVTLALLAIGEVAGSFLLLAVASSAIVLVCLIAVPSVAALAILRRK